MPTNLETVSTVCVTVSECSRRRRTISLVTPHEPRQFIRYCKRVLNVAQELPLRRVRKCLPLQINWIVEGVIGSKIGCYFCIQVCRANSHVNTADRLPSEIELRTGNGGLWYPHQARKIAECGGDVSDQLFVAIVVIENRTRELH